MIEARTESFIMCVCVSGEPNGLWLLVLVRCHMVIYFCDDVPCSLQHHDCVLTLISARRGELNINVRQGTAARVAMATTRHAAHLDSSVGCPRGEGLQARRKSMELYIQGQRRWTSCSSNYITKVLTKWRRNMQINMASINQNIE